MQTSYECILLDSRYALNYFVSPLGSALKDESNSLTRHPMVLGLIAPYFLIYRFSKSLYGHSRTMTGWLAPMPGYRMFSSWISFVLVAEFCCGSGYIYQYSSVEYIVDWPSYLDLQTMYLASVAFPYSMLSLYLFCLELCSD